MKECQYCKQTDIPDDAKTCYHCGKTIVLSTEQKMFAAGGYLMILGLLITAGGCLVLWLIGLF